MHILGYLMAVVIGLVMGLIGGGGSILSVPVFAYIFSMDAVSATTLSLFVVGVTSAVGSVGFIRQGQVNFTTAFRFGVPSILGILFSRRVVVPHLPDFILNRYGLVVSKDMFILVIFAALMLFSAIRMIQKKERIRPQEQNVSSDTLLISQGLLVGIITGFIGAGGGFLIVPALVMLVGMRMKQAVATSLFIIAINSLIGFISSLDSVAVDWVFLLSFTALSVVGILLGVRMARKIEGRKLKPIFGWFVLVMGIWIIIKELFLNSLL